MTAARGHELEAIAALLERCYRLALLLRERVSAGDASAALCDDEFERLVLTMELVAVLDEARGGLVAEAARQVKPSA